MPQKFHERFNIEVGLEHAKGRFINRVHNEIFYAFVFSQRFTDNDRYQLRLAVATHLGDLFENESIVNMVGKDFHRNLQAIEGLHANLSHAPYKQQLDNLVASLLAAAEVDLGIQWKNGHFLPAGAALLDAALVNDVLHWLRGQSYMAVVTPFEKGLRHLLESAKRPELTGDVITDMYESLEGLARIVTGRPDKDLSANQEIFIAKVDASEQYKKLLRQYIEYANAFRHAMKEHQPRPKVSRKEAESFVYLTGLFIRLAI